MFVDDNTHVTYSCRFNSLKVMSSFVLEFNTALKEH